MVAGDGVSTLAFFIFAVAGNWVWLLLGIFLEAGYSVTIPVGNAIITDSINPDSEYLFHIYNGGVGSRSFRG